MIVRKRQEGSSLRKSVGIGNEAVFSLIRGLQLRRCGRGNGSDRILVKLTLMSRLLVGLVKFGSSRVLLFLLLFAGGSLLVRWGPLKQRDVDVS